jgi:hypothetical protein
VNAAGATGLPAGYTGRTDREGVNIADAKYTQRGDMWEVQTGPAHIVYAAKDNATGSYTAQTRIEQMERPRTPRRTGCSSAARTSTSRRRSTRTSSCAAAASTR